MKNNQISVRLSFKYMGFVAAITLLLTAGIFAALFYYVKSVRKNDLQESSEQIMQALLSGNMEAEELDFLDLPYFIVYAIFEKETKNLIATNDKLLPILELKPKKLSEYYDKDFYSDGELKIAVYNQEFVLDNKVLVLECAMDIENDSLSKMIRGFPKILLFCVLPIFIISFFISLVISKKTIEAFKKLESAFEKEKSFTSNVSHELKTPLSIIDGHANLIKRWGKENPEQLEKSVNAILEESSNMNNIIHTLLELSKIENGLIKIQKSSFFISNLFVKIREEFAVLNKNLKIEIEDEDFVELSTDEKVLHQILSALVSNSVKFAGSSSKIILRCIKNNEQIIIEVQDDGKGFSEEILPFVFERFYKGDKSHTRNGSGAGLGLSIAKALVHLLGGKITAKNGESGGAIVSICFLLTQN